MIPPAIRYLRDRASFYAQIGRICKRLRRSNYAMVCRHADKAEVVIQQCAGFNACWRCMFIKECVTRYDNLLNLIDKEEK